MGQHVTEQRDTVATGATVHLLTRGGGGRPPVVELAGEFDLDTVPQVDRFLRRALGPLYQQDDLVLDLSRTTFVDSSFIAFLVRLSSVQRARRRELLLVRPEGQVRRVLAIVGLHNIVPVFDSVDDAVGSLAGGRGAVIPPALRPAGAQRTAERPGC